MLTPRTECCEAKKVVHQDWQCRNAPFVLADMFWLVTLAAPGMIGMVPFNFRFS